MASAHSKLLATDRFWYMVDDLGKWHRCGPGKKGEQLARAWAGKLTAAKYEGASGMISGGALWTLADLKREHIREAARLGQWSATPMGKAGSVSYLESHYSQLIGFFGDGRNLDEIRPADLADYVADRLASRKRTRTAGPATVNRDLAVLRKGLRIARAYAKSSNYRGNPFIGWEQCDEKAARRPPVALTQEDRDKFLRILWDEDPACGAYAEVVSVTASRRRQMPVIENGIAYYAAQKGGKPRAFPLAEYPRLAELLALPREWNRRSWRRAAERFGRADLKPRDLRTTEASLEFAAGATVEDVQMLLGHGTPAMANAVYIRLYGRPIVRRVRRTA